ncbi:MAG: nucleoid-associated protein [Candidatus Nanopelagicaceae bacterium]|nr:nucleoid-associated protein [Candidatus Nanopelagicaceae bacterium]
MQFNTLSLDELIIHRVPGRGDNNANGPVLSQGASPYDPNVFAFFRRRLSGVMSSKSLRIEPDPSRSEDFNSLLVFSAVNEIITTATNFIASSQRIARHLWNIQDGRNSAGLLVIARGQIDGLPCVGILKLEHENGVQAEESHDANGNFVFKVILHNDLLLTDNTAVFKAVVLRQMSGVEISAVAQEADDFNIESDRDGTQANVNIADPSFGDVSQEVVSELQLVAQASDLQSQRDVAGFFLQEFLGCRFFGDSPEKTRKYYESGEVFIDTKVTDPEKRVRYQIALLAQMNSNSLAIDPDQFVRENLELEDRQDFLNHLREQGVETTLFVKDTGRIKGRIKQVTMNFKSGIRLLGAPDALREHTQVDDGEGDRSVMITITDELLHVRGTG